MKKDFVHQVFSHLLCHVCSKPACRQLTRGQLEDEALWDHHQSMLNDVLVCHASVLCLGDALLLCCCAVLDGAAQAKSETAESSTSFQAEHKLIWVLQSSSSLQMTLSQFNIPARQKQSSGKHA